MHSVTNPTDDYIAMQRNYVQLCIPEGFYVVVVYVRSSNISHVKI